MFWECNLFFFIFQILTDSIKKKQSIKIHREAAAAFGLVAGRARDRRLVRDDL